MPKPLALITGASSGIGAAYANHLASAGYHLILTARRAKVLEEMAHHLQNKFGVQVEVLAVDLSTDEGMARLEQKILSLEELDLLVNNAGFGIPAFFMDTPMQRQVDMVNLHVVAPMRLTRAALPGMISRRQGAIINVSSVSAFTPLPISTSYSGTKAFLVNFSEALQLELAGTGVKIQALCPGFTRTAFHNTPEYTSYPVTSRIPGFLWGQADKVVRHSLRALQGDRVVVIPTLLDTLLVFVSRTWPFNFIFHAVARRIR